MKNWPIAICTCMTMLIATNIQAETVYKWKDTDGKVMYSQTPPTTGVDYVVVEQRYNKASEAPAPRRTDLAAVNKGVATDSNAENGKSEKELIAESEQIKQENCAQVKRNLESLTSRGQVTIKDGDLYRKLTEEERQAKISEHEQLKDEYCG